MGWQKLKKRTPTLLAGLESRFGSDVWSPGDFPMGVVGAGRPGVLFVDLADEEKQAIEDAIGELRGVLESEDSAEIEAKTNALQEASMKLGEAMYKSAQAEAEGGEDFSTAGEDASDAADEDSDETVVDADFEEVQDDKKTGD